MGLFRRKRGGGARSTQPGPDWAQPMSAEDAVLFLAAVARELERRGLPHEVGDGMARVERGGEWQEYGLSNLAQFCHQAGHADWQQAIATHFDNLFTAADEDAEFQELSRDFEAVRSLLKVRLYPTETFAAVGDKGPARWEIATGLTGVFVFDLPTTVKTTNTELVAHWGKSQDELLAIALENVRGDEVESEAMAEGASAPIACLADHFFAASHALLLGERLPPEANGQAVFAVPQRHALLYAPLCDVGVVESIQRVILTSLSLFQKGPGSITPDPYWWRDGSVMLLPTRLDGGKLEFYPPAEFVQALNALPSA